MKYIKKYNEELDPRTYRSAASSLRYYNKDKRADALSDYADDKEFGFYKFHIGNSLSDGIAVLADNYVFTDPKLIGIYYGNTSDEYPENIINKKDTDDEATDLVSAWGEGRENLYITFEFGFRPTKETINLNKNREPINNELLRNPSGKLSRWNLSNRVPLFSIELSLCGWGEGLEEWDAEAKWQAEQDGVEFTPSTVSDIYEYEKQEYFSLTRPNINSFRYCGIFADRQSAFKFKKLLPELINEDAQSKIVDVLRIIGATGDDVDRVLKSFNTIRLHGLYDDVGDSHSFSKRKWFRQIN